MTTITGRECEADYGQVNDPRCAQNALNRLYMEALNAYGDGEILKIKNPHVRLALRRAAHALDYHALCEQGKFI